MEMALALPCCQNEGKNLMLQYTMCIRYGNYSVVNYLLPSYTFEYEKKNYFVMLGSKNEHVCISIEMSLN